ncbi:MAG TPA: aminodeoxychorismate synthase component I [Candidatus Goldiibacteriota bacterium]|nr:aminodeoxychorismate synthase component I [Candidatus Goldiibacteriota bacterium]
MEIKLKNQIIFNAGFAGAKPVLFQNPVKTITCNSRGQITSKLGLAQRLIDRGYYLAGYFSYELGHYLQVKSGMPRKTKAPLFYLAVYKKPSAFKPAPQGKYCAGAVKADTGIKEYGRKFRKILGLINSGELYQVNECFKLKFDFRGDALSLFMDLCSRQEAEYAAFLDDGERKILSVSPELFFTIKGKQIVMKPMKGTLLKNPGLKKRDSRLLRGSEKNRAENIMIVDLIRNDLGKICETNTVKAGPLLEVKEYRTLYQMTSTVRGKLRKDVGIYQLLKALFPSGSVTGAPKIRAMQVIKETEKSARGVYTGAIGFIGPKMKTAAFNIPIRTVVIDKKGRAEMGVGSGIVHDSREKSEYEECLGKAKFLFPSLHGHKLIESLLLKNGKYFLLNRHLNRLVKSAVYFGVPLKKEEARQKLLSFSRKIRKGMLKVRLLVDAYGKIRITGCTKIADNSKPGTRPFRVAISGIKMNSGDAFLGHKTTNRSVYDSEYAKYARKGYGDVIFANERGEITEAHSSNIFIKKKGIFYTPPVSCGLLPGTYRQLLLDKGGKYREKVLRKRDLRTADSIYLCNSVRGMREVLV